MTIYTRYVDLRASEKGKATKKEVSKDGKLEEREKIHVTICFLFLMMIA